MFAAAASASIAKIVADDIFDGFVKAGSGRMGFAIRVAAIVKNGHSRAAPPPRPEHH
jgi:hypothetical protein